MKIGVTRTGATDLDQNLPGARFGHSDLAELSRPPDGRES
jgi:hypothetical protein